MNTSVMRNAAVAAVLILALACGSTQLFRGKYYMEHGQYDEAVEALETALKENPRNVKIRTELARAKLAASQRHFDNAKRAMARDEMDVAFQELDKTLRYDPGNQYAQDMLQKVVAAANEKERKDREAKLSLDSMKKAAEQNAGVPQLDPASNIPIVLKFKDAPLKTVLDAIAKASGVNFLFDDRAELTKRVSVDFSKVNLDQVLDYLMMQTKHFYKVIDSKTLIIVPDNKQKREEYQDQVIRTFYLSNADVKEVFQLVRSILQIRKMAMNQDLNSITLQDTPENVAMAQRIIENNDKSKGEVVVDVELLEVNSNLTRELGINLTSRTFTIGPGSNVTTDSTTGKKSIAEGGPVPLNEFGKIISHNLFVAPVPNLIVNLLLSDTDSQVLAKPQLRVMEGQKAMVHIGDRIPIPTSNQYLGSTGTSTTYTPIVSYTYQDTGVKIEVEPKVHHNREVTLKLKTEVSAVTGYVGSPNALTGDQPIIGTRESNTVLRLQDGETSLLAGLIRKEDKRAISGLPGIAEIPILRRLFSNTKDEKNSTDVVILVTPHIIRMPNITQDNLEPVYVGTGSNPKLQGAAASPFAPTGPSGGVTPAPGAAGPMPSETGAGGAADEQSTKSDAGDQDTQPTQQARILLSPTSLQSKVGDPLILNLVLIGATDLRGMHVEVDFPPDVLAFQGADEGTFFKMGSGATSFTGQEVRPGYLTIDMAKTDPTGASGSGLVARLRFMSQKAGEGRVTLAQAVAQALSGQPSPLPPSFATVSVKDAAPGGGPPQESAPNE